jgi:3-methylfumaryl-CoA hydratase
MAESRGAPLESSELDHYKEWIGAVRTENDEISSAPLAGWNATFDRSDARPVAGEPLPPLAHWLYFLPRARQAELGRDGHPMRGGFLPPVRLPRRMWAGSRIHWHKSLYVGDAVTRTSLIRSVEHKKGRSGDLVFVVVEHRLSTARGLCLTEEHDIVYRDLVTPPAVSLAQTNEAPAADWSAQVEPTDVLLFRYSALTFNGHRIHYDRRYATEVEGYPGLVVHGPLIATLLLEAARHHLGPLDPARFEFTAKSPLFDRAPFTVAGRALQSPGGNQIEMWASDASGSVCMNAMADLGPR